jgi:nucleolar pre-ribosomal-associated protein 2
MTANVLASSGMYRCVMVTDVVAFLPRPSGTEAKTNSCGPRAALEQEDREDDTEGQTKAGTDEHGREAAVPLCCC